jgi:nucleoside-diphosphate-sugar epimerase
MRYFVTGATGFIGTELVRQLVAGGHEVTALVRSPEKAVRVSGPGVTLHRGDITEKESMRAGMVGADGVFHVAGWYKIGVRDRSLGEATNVDGTRNVLELMHELEIPKGVYTSTVAVFGDTHGKLVDESYKFHGHFLAEYDRTKWLAHYMVAEPMAKQGLPLVIVLPGIVYGQGDESPMHNSVVQYLRGRLLALPHGTAYCWAHIEDTARGHILAMERGRVGESYILTGPQHTVIAVFEMAEAVTGIKAPRIRVSPTLSKVAAALSALIGKVVPLPETYNAETLRIAAGVTHLGSNAKAVRELGFATRPLADGWPDTVRHETEQLGI